MSTVEYLRGYHPFDDDILECVEHAAYNQQGLSWPEFVRRYDIPEPEIFHPKDGNPIEVVDMGPSDYESVFVYHQPMGCQLDSNMMTHVATMAHSSPSSRVISVGNPSKPGRNSGKLSPSEALQVANGYLKPVVGPTLEYMRQAGVEQAVHIGESYGAEKTAASAQFAFAYDHEVTDGVMTEPVFTNGLFKTATAFMRTGRHADKYLRPVRELSDAFKSAEELKESSWQWMMGLGRISNLAIGRALGGGRFGERLNSGLIVNPEMQATVVWGTESELALNGIARALTDPLQWIHAGRLHTMPLDGQTHAMNLDIFLNSAIALQSLKNHAISRVGKLL